MQIRKGTYGFLSSAGFALSGFAFIDSRKLRMPSPNPLPSSGSFLGPKTSNAMKNHQQVGGLKQIVKHDDSCTKDSAVRAIPLSHIASHAGV